MLFTTLNLISLIECVRDLRRDIRRARYWGLGTYEAIKLRRLSFKTIVLIAHLSPKPLFKLHKTATAAEAKIQKADLRELFVRVALTMSNNPKQLAYWFGEEHLLHFDPFTDDQTLRFHVVFNDPGWLNGPITMRSFLPKHRFAQVEPTTVEHSALIEEPAFLDLLDTDLSHSIVANLFDLSVNRVIELRNVLVKPKPYRRNTGAQTWELSAHKKDRFFLFEGLRHFLCYREAGFSKTQSFVEAARFIQSLPLYRSHASPVIDFRTNLYWALVSFGHIKDDQIKSGSREKIQALIAPIFQEPLNQRSRFKTFPIFEPIGFSSDKQNRLVDRINAAMIDNDFTKTRFYEITKETSYVETH